MYCQCLLGGSTVFVTIKMGKTTRSLVEAEMFTRERVLYPILHVIVTVDPPKRYCQCIADDEAVQQKIVD